MWQKVFSVQRLSGSFRCAFRGIKTFFSNTPNARIHLLATIVVLLLATILCVNRIEWAVLMLCIVLVLSLEALNSALEHLSDRVSTEYSTLIRNAKDMAAGAVLLATIGSVIIGAIIFIPYLL